MGTTSSKVFARVAWPKLATNTNINMKVLAIFALFLAAASASPQWAGIAQLGYVATGGTGCSAAQVSACNLHFSRFPGTTPQECGNLCALCDLCDATEISAPRPVGCKYCTAKCVKTCTDGLKVCKSCGIRH